MLLNFPLNNKHVAIVGNDSVAEQRVLSCLPYAKHITWYSDSPTDTMKQLSQSTPSLTINALKDSAKTHPDLVFITNETDHTQKDLHTLVTKNWNAPINVTDNSALCDFTMPAIIDRNPVQIAITTNGYSPTLAGKWRTALESETPEHLGTLAKTMASWRKRLKDLNLDTATIRQLLGDLFSSAAATKVLNNDSAAAESHFQDFVSALQNKTLKKLSHKGRIFLVGSGPGNPRLLTLKALEIMRSADVIVHDRLIPKELLALARVDAERIDVGKKAKEHTISQNQVNDILVAAAQAGKTVCRLKGGDASFFSRVGEEIDHLTKHNIPWEIVPGVTSASAASAALGVPLTHREKAQTCLFVTGHGAQTINNSNTADPTHTPDNITELPWQEMTQSGQTLVIYMGLLKLEHIVEKLLEHGLPATTLAAAVHWASTPQEQQVIAPLNQFIGAVRDAGLRSPTLLIIGNVLDTTTMGD